MTTKRLTWHWDNESDTLQAPSVYHDEGTPLPYAIEIGEPCVCYFEGEVLKEGNIEECILAANVDDMETRQYLEEEKE